MKLLLTLTLSLGVSSCLAAPIDGKISLETPVSGVHHLSDDSSMVLGSLSTKLSQRLTLEGKAQYNFGDRGPSRRQVLNEDKWRGTIFYALGSDISIYSFYESRFSRNEDRVVVGATYRFRLGN